MDNEALSHISVRNEDQDTCCGKVSSESGDLLSAEYDGGDEDNDNDDWDDDLLDEGSKRDSEEDTGGAHTQLSGSSPACGSKQYEVQRSDRCLPNVSLELQASDSAQFDHPWKSGNIYSRVQVSNEARVHLGDSITVNNHYSGSPAAKREHMVARIEVTEEFLMTLLAAITLIKEMMQTATGLLVLVQVTLSAYRLPKQIGDELAIFEDALGRFQRIDLRFLDNWPAFQQRLESDFQGTPGSRRILAMRYRLCHRAGGNYLIDPWRPPPFSSVFKHGQHVQMSIHYDWEEVSDEQCPRCSLEQDCNVDAETACGRCGFNYRGQVKCVRLELLNDLDDLDDDGDVDDVDDVDDLDDEGAPEPKHSDDIPKTAPPRIERNERDAPSHFSRITISKEPKSWHRCYICGRNVRLSHWRRHCRIHLQDGYMDDGTRAIGLAKRSRASLSWPLAAGWLEAFAADGHKYYYDIHGSRTRQRPSELPFVLPPP
jgi:hypothetical protein